MARMNKRGPLRAARSSSRAKQLGVVTFAEAGEHKMRLRVKHAVEEKVSEQPIRVDSALFFFLALHHSKYRMNRQYLELHLELAKETSISKNNR